MRYTPKQCILFAMASVLVIIVEVGCFLVVAAYLTGPGWECIPYGCGR